MGDDMETTIITDRTGDEIRISDSLGELDIRVRRRDDETSAILLCFDREQAKRIRKAIKRRLREPGLIVNKD